MKPLIHNLKNPWHYYLYDLDRMEKFYSGDFNAWGWGQPIRTNLQHHWIVEP